MRAYVTSDGRLFLVKTPPKGVVLATPFPSRAVLVNYSRTLKGIQADGPGEESKERCRRRKRSEGELETTEKRASSSN